MQIPIVPVTLVFPHRPRSLRRGLFNFRHIAPISLVPRAPYTTLSHIDLTPQPPATMRNAPAPPRPPGKPHPMTTHTPSIATRIAGVTLCALFASSALADRAADHQAQNHSAIERDDAFLDPGILAMRSEEDCVPTLRPGPAVMHRPSAGGKALITFDDGTGPSLYIGGAFVEAGGVPASGIVRWDGSGWYKVGGGVNGTVEAMAIYDDGSGPALYVAGEFTEAGGIPANNIARWNGHHWSALGSGVNNYVRALHVFDDGLGGGPALYVGGNFNNAGGASASRIAKWNGSSWSPLGAGVNSLVRTLTVHDDGNGLALYAGGNFANAGGQPVGRVAKWNGTTWSSLAGGMDDQVWALESHDDGSGVALYACGRFNTAGGVSVAKVAKWDGTSWSAHGVFHENGRLLKSHNGFLYQGGEPPYFVNPIHRWDGQSWSTVTSVSGSINAFGVYEPSSDPEDAALILSFAQSPMLGRVDGGSIHLLGKDCRFVELVGPSTPYVTAVASHDAGDGSRLYVGGPFRVNPISHSESWTHNIASFTAEGWRPLGSGLFNESQGGGNDANGVQVRAMTTYDDGSGPALYIAGKFARAVQSNNTIVHANNIARWDGESWSALGDGLEHSGLMSVLALQVFDDGGGPALYAAGSFTLADGQPAARIARWDGSEWSPLGSGFNTTPTSLAVFDDGSGPALYAAGNFSLSGSTTVNRIARWDGTEWLPLGDGVNGTINSLTAITIGASSVLCAGGTFTQAGGMPANRVAMWDGQNWSGIGDPSWSSSTRDDVTATAVFDDGSGTYLYAASRRNVMRYQAQTNLWDTIATMPHSIYGGHYVYTMEAIQYAHFPDPVLVLGGSFPSMDSITSDYIVELHPCTPGVEPPPPPPPCLGDINGDLVVDLDDFIILAGNFGSGPGMTPQQGDLNGDGFVDLDDFIILAGNFGNDCN